jgi:hypothetical protein
MLEMVGQTASAIQFLSAEPDSCAVWSELQNKIEVFSLFEYADSELGLISNPGLQLREVVHRAFQLGSYHSVWAIEGVGHHYASLHFPGKFLGDDNIPKLPAASLIPLHTGMGLALAEYLLESIRKCPANGAELIRAFAHLCWSNSCSGYAGAVFEALGLVARSLYPNLMPALDEYLSPMETLVSYFWHGVGRGVYLHPINSLPLCSAPWKALEMCQSEPPHEAGRQNAVAGLAWALTLVNIRHPEVLAAFLRWHGREVADSEAFANGMWSSMAVWRDVSPGDIYLNVLERYVPNNAGALLAQQWKQCVTQSCRQSLSYQMVHASKRVISDLFRYQRFSAVSNQPPT